VYADINGLKMFYEIRGPSDPAKVPVVLLHGALSATGSSFGTLPDLLARTRQVITVEQQGHGRTADIDRPMSVQAMADDTLALLASLGIGLADLLGYSLGAGIALNIITHHPASHQSVISRARPSGDLVRSSPPDSADAQRHREHDHHRCLVPDPGPAPRLGNLRQAVQQVPVTAQVTPRHRSRYRSRWAGQV
jgi:pimeloyl-ACP methyl ester carboxylesterase